MNVEPLFCIIPHAWSIIWPGVKRLSSRSTMLPMLARCASISRLIC
jgi:hypothetical protein